DEERRDAKPGAVLGLERLFVAFTERHDGAHVHFVEGREHRGGVLHLDETPGDRRTTFRHPNALFAAFARRARSGPGRRSWHVVLRLRRRRRRRGDWRTGL